MLNLGSTIILNLVIFRLMTPAVPGIVARFSAVNVPACKVLDANLQAPASCEPAGSPNVHSLIRPSPTATPWQHRFFFRRRLLAWGVWLGWRPAATELRVRPRNSTSFSISAGLRGFGKSTAEDRSITTPRTQSMRWSANCVPAFAPRSRDCRTRVPLGWGGAGEDSLHDTSIKTSFHPVRPVN